MEVVIIRKKRRKTAATR
jgi:hypothetical protein